MADNQFLIFTEMGEVALATPAKEVFSVFSRFRIPVQPAQYAFAHLLSMPLPTRSVCLCPPAQYAFAHPLSMPLPTRSFTKGYSISDTRKIFGYMSSMSIEI